MTFISKKAIIVSVSNKGGNMEIKNGSQLRKYRKDKKMTIKQFAEELGVLKGTLSNFEYKHPRRKLPVWFQKKIDAYLRHQTLWYKILKFILVKRK